MNKSWPLLSLHGIGHWCHVGLRSLRRSRWGPPPHIRRLLRPCSIFIAMHLNKTAQCNQKSNKQILELHQVHLKTCWFKHFNYCTISEDCTLYSTKGTVAACETSCPFQNPSKISSRMQCDVLHNLNSKAATATPLLDAISLFVFCRYIPSISLQYHYDIATSLDVSWVLYNQNCQASIALVSAVSISAFPRIRRFSPSTWEHS